MGCGSSKSAGTVVSDRSADAPKQQQQSSQEQAQQNNQQQQPETQPKSPGERQANTDTEDFKAWQQAALTRHNELRAKHGCPPLALSKDLCTEATAWAEHLASTGQFEHSKTKCGENLAMHHGASDDTAGVIATDMWYDEIKDYDFDKQGFSMNTGHFTQVIWKKSTEVGFGVGVKDNVWTICANYMPAGNMMSEFENNVPRLK